MKTKKAILLILKGLLFLFFKQVYDLLNTLQFELRL